MSEMTATMVSALGYMASGNGKIIRHPGGYWARVDWHRWTEPYFGTSTIEALVKRGVAEYTDWKDGRKGRFPVEVTRLIINRDE